MTIRFINVMRGTRTTGAIRGLGLETSIHAIHDSKAITHD